ncbi:2-C-methyl-D-erythritol 2,4-cyclodiphosphate synthase [soil metagenome]
MMVHGLTPARKAPAPSDQAESRPALSRPTAPFLVGHGYDIHRLEKNPGKLVLAGVLVTEEISVVAHSDGDVIYHAIVDAILGALGAGDIGELFPDTDPKWKAAASDVFVQESLARARLAGYRVSNVDVSLLLERPKISAHKSQMIDNIRRLLEPVAVVNLKAGTNEQCDAIGRREAVAAHAVVLLAAQR